MLVNACVSEWRTRLAPNTVYHRVGLLRKLLAVLEKFGAPASPQLLPKIRRPQPRPTTATPQQIAALLRCAPAHLRLFILLAWQLALRFSETFQVTPANTNLAKGTATIRTKGGKTRTIPLTDDVTALLKSLGTGDLEGRQDWPYMALLKGKPIHPRGLRTAWWYLCDRANVKGIHPHDLRRTTATNLYATCKDLRAVQQFLGHESLASTTMYLAPLSEEKLRDLHRLLNFHAGKPASDLKQ